MNDKEKKNVILKRDKNISKQWKAKDRKTEIQNAKKTLLECVWIENNFTKLN
jgi:hypothetical protein